MSTPTTVPSTTTPAAKSRVTALDGFLIAAVLAVPALIGAGAAGLFG